MILGCHDLIELLADICSFPAVMPQMPQMPIMNASLAWTGGDFDPTPDQDGFLDL